MAAFFRRLSKSTAGTIVMVLFLLAIPFYGRSSRFLLVSAVVFAVLFGTGTGSFAPRVLVPVVNVPYEGLAAADFDEDGDDDEVDDEPSRSARTSSIARARRLRGAVDHQRASAIREAVADIRAIEAERGVTRDSLERMKARREKIHGGASARAPAWPPTSR